MFFECICFFVCINDFKGKFSLPPLKFQEIFNLNPKVSKLTVYPPEVSKSGKVNLPSN
jgi:hypothetical protein